MVVLLECASLIDTKYLAIATWVISKIFASTVTDEDESSGHVFVSFESQHPYKHNVKVVESIYVPYATKLTILFDKRCQTENASDSLTFFEDEDCTKIARVQQALLQFS